MNSILAAKRVSSFSPFSLLRLSLSTEPTQQKEVPFIAQYLVSTFGFSMDRALKVSSYSNLAPIKTPDRPNSVIQFLKRNGFSDSQIKSLVTFQPIILSSNVEKTLEPRARKLMAAGFTREILVELIRTNPRALDLKKTLSRLQFWRNFVGNSDEILLKIIQKNHLLMSMDIETYWTPRINVLIEYGLPKQHIIVMLTRGHGRPLCQNLDSLKQIIEQTNKLGFSCGSLMFIPAINVVASLKKESWDKKVEFYIKTFGWSKEELFSAIKKYPQFFSLSSKNVKSKMDFLTNEVEIDPKSLVFRPDLLTVSLEKRMVPRHHVLSILKENGINTNSSFYSVCKISEKRFVDKFVEPYKEAILELAKTYYTAKTFC